MNYIPIYRIWDASRRVSPLVAGTVSRNCRFMLRRKLYTVSGFGIPRRQPGLRLARGVGATHGAHGGILSRTGVPLCLFAQRQALHQAARAFGRGLRSLRASAESDRRGRQGEHNEDTPVFGSFRSARVSSLIVRGVRRDEILAEPPRHMSTTRKNVNPLIIN